MQAAEATYDACIAGAGVIGLTVARTLTRAGMRVVLVDPNDRARTTSWAGFGSLTPFSDSSCSPATRAFAQHSVELYRELIPALSAETGLPIDFSDLGLLELAFEDKELHQLEQAARAFERAGVRARLLNAGEALRLEPLIAPDVLGALHVVDEPWTDTHALLEALWSWVRRHGVETALGDTVIEVLTHASTVTGVRLANGRTVSSRAVIVAAGFGSGEIRGVPPLQLSVVKGEALEVQLDPKSLARHLAWGNGFITPRSDGRLLLGATHDAQARPDDADTGRITAASAQTILNATLRMIPALGAGHITRTWKGFRPCAPDRQPIIGGFPSMPGLLIATGHSGLGVTMAPATAEAVADMLVQGTLPHAVASFSPARLQAAAGVVAE